MAPVTQCPLSGTPLSRCLVGRTAEGEAPPSRPAPVEPAQAQTPEGGAWAGGGRARLAPGSNPPRSCQGAAQGSGAWAVLSRLGEGGDRQVGSVLARAPWPRSTLPRLSSHLTSPKLGNPKSKQGRPSPLGSGDGSGWDRRPHGAFVTRPGPHELKQHRVVAAWGPAAPPGQRLPGSRLAPAGPPAAGKPTPGPAGGGGGGGIPRTALLGWGLLPPRPATPHLAKFSPSLPGRIATSRRPAAPPSRPAAPRPLTASLPGAWLTHPTPAWG